MGDMGESQAWNTAWEMNGRYVGVTDMVYIMGDEWETMGVTGVVDRMGDQWETMEVTGLVHHMGDEWETCGSHMRGTQNGR